MGKKDIYQYDYLDDNCRFADQVNGALFGGRQVIRPEELEPADMQIVYLGRETGKRENVSAVIDKARLWRGRKIHILAVENQNYVDYQMVLRNMLSESLGYHKQWKQKKRFHSKAGDLKRNSNAYLSGIRREEKFIPIITLVVYFGADHSWDGARCLYDLLDIDEEIKEYVTNYKLNLYDCHEHDTFEEYRTGLRQVFETIRYAKDKDKLREIMKENHEAYSRIDSDTKELLEVVANVKIPEEFRKVENGEDRYDMCKAFEDMKLEGIQQGVEQEKLRCAKSFIVENVARNQQKDYIIEILLTCFQMKEEEALALYRECTV